MANTQLTQVSFANHSYKIFFPEVSAEDDNQPVIKEALIKVFGEDAKVYFHEGELEIFSTPREKTEIAPVSQSSNVEILPDGTISEPAPVARSASRQSGPSLSGGLPDGIVFGQ